MTADDDPDILRPDVDAHVPGRFDRLPEAVRLEDTIASQDAEPPPDPTMGRDPERDFMLRFGLP